MDVENIEFFPAIQWKLLNIRKLIENNKNEIIKSFKKKYNCKKLVWYKHTENMHSAIQHEKRMKKWI